MKIALALALAVLLGGLVPLGSSPPPAQVQSSASLAAEDAAVTLSPTAQIAAHATEVGVSVSGTFSATLAFEATTDDSTWFAVQGVPVGGGASVSNLTGTGNYRVDIAGFRRFRVRMSAYTSGAAAVQLFATPPGLADLSGMMAPQSGAASGVSIYRNISTLAGTGPVVKASEGNLYGWYLYNANASSIRYVKLYNKATAPTSADTPVMTIPLPPNSGANVSLTFGASFSAGIGIRATTGAADSDNVSPGLNEVTVNLFYK